jgi:hypothetical protein
VDVLRYYSQQGDACKPQIQELLQLIETESALPPLLVVDALASGPDTTLDVCQEYLERQFSNDFTVVHEDRKESEKCARMLSFVPRQLAAGNKTVLPCAHLASCDKPSLFSCACLFASSAQLQCTAGIEKTQQMHRKRWKHS